MTPDPQDIPVPQEVPAAFSANGSGPHPTPAQRTADGVAAIAGMLSQFEQAMANVLMQVPLRIIPQPQQQRLCCTCLVNRVAWETRYVTALKAAIARAREAHGLPEDAPLPPGTDAALFLPPELRPDSGGPSAMPPVNPAITVIGGNELCPAHLPGSQGSRPTLLVATASLSPTAMTQFGL